MGHNTKVSRLLSTAKWFAWIVFFTFLLPVGWVVGSRLRVAHVEKYTQHDAAPHGNRARAYDVDMYYQEFGLPDAKPLVLVHGTGAWSGTWHSNVDAMVQAGWRVIAIDLPPFGFTEHPETVDYSRAAQAKRIIGIIHTLKLENVTLLGHSFGGGPAAEAAMMGDSAIAHLVLVDAAIGLQSSSAETCAEPSGLLSSLLGWKPIRTALIASVGTNPLFSEFLLRKFVARKEVVTPERTAIYQQPFVTQNFTASLGDWAWQFAAKCENAASYKSTGFEQLTLPVSLMWGDEDTITPLAQAQELQRLIKNSRLTVLHGVGHIPQIENISLFNEQLRKVLENTPSLP